MQAETCGEVGANGFSSLSDHRMLHSRPRWSRSHRLEGIEPECRGWLRSRLKGIPAEGVTFRPCRAAPPPPPVALQVTWPPSPSRSTRGSRIV